SPRPSQTGSASGSRSQQPPSSTTWNLATSAPATSNPHGAPRSDRQYTLLCTATAASSAVTSSSGAVFSSLMIHAWTIGQQDCPAEHSQPAPATQCSWPWQPS